jgi:ribonuclease HI
LNELALLPKLEDRKSSLTPSAIKPRWSPPPIDIIKQNVDGDCARNDMKGSVTVVARDHTWKYVGSSVMVFSGIVDPPTLKALACKEALVLADDLGLGKILISSDCQQVVNDISSGHGGAYVSVRKEINQHSSDSQKQDLYMKVVC